MASSTRSIQFGTGTHSGASIGAWDDDTTPNVDQTGAAHPVHQGVMDVTPLSAKTMSTIDRATAWRNHRSASSLPQPYAKRNAGSIYSFDDQ